MDYYQSRDEPVLRVKRELERDVYDTDLPLMVAERCRTAGRYDDGTRAEPPALLAVWYALRWLMAAFPERRGFGQRAIAQIAGVDQKPVHKRLRKLLELELVVEAGHEQHARLTGKDGLPKIQPIYTIPLRELKALSAEHAVALVEHWERRLWGGSPSTTPPPEGQLTLDLGLDPEPLDPFKDQGPDPSRDQADPFKDQGPDPSRDQADPLRDQALDPLKDQSPDPLKDHMGKKERKKERGDHAARVAPNSPPGEVELAAHPLDLWAMAAGAEPGLLETQLLAALAAEHDRPTGGHGWYWLGRALLSVAMGGQVNEYLPPVRKTLRRWRETESYGSDAPARPRSAARVPMVGAAPAAGGPRVSNMPILTASWVPPEERSRWDSRFRAAEDPERKRQILAEFATTFPPPGAQAAD